MGTAAKVLPVALAVQADLLAGRNRRDDLGLVVLADVLEMLDGGIARQHAAVHFEVAARDLGHALLDGREVIARKRRLVGEIVIKAVLDHRPDGHLRAREELLNRIGEQVGGGVPDDLETVGVLVRDDAHRGVMIEGRRGVDQAAVHLAGQRRLGEA